VRFAVEQGHTLFLMSWRNPDATCGHVTWGDYLSQGVMKAIEVALVISGADKETVQVLVFRSADPDFFISHVDVTRVEEYRQEAAKLTGEASIALLFRISLAILR